MALSKIAIAMVATASVAHTRGFTLTWDGTVWKELA